MPDVIYGYVKSHTNFSGISLPEYAMHSQTFLKPLLKIGDSTNKAKISTTSIPLAEIYATTALTTGTVIGQNIVVVPTGVMTGGGSVHGLYVTIDTDVKIGGSNSAIYGKLDFSDTGAAHGMASAICAELIVPNSSLSRGALYALELEMGAGASSSWGSAGPVGLIYAGFWGTMTNIDGSAFFLDVQGLSAGSGNLLGAGSNSLKVRIGTTTEYLVLSEYEDSLSIGLTGARKTKITGIPEIAVWETSALLTGTQDLVKLDYNHTGTCTAGYVKVLRATLTSTGYLPSSAKVLYASLTVAAAGSIGYAAGLATDVTLPNASLAHGAVYGLDIQLIGQASTDFSSAGPVAAMHFTYGGTVTEFDSDGFLFVIEGVSEGNDKLCDNGGTPAEADGGIRIQINGATRYLLYANDAEN